MANIKKGARAYYADTDYRRDGTIEAYNKIDGMPAIPIPEESDAGKVVKVSENGNYGLAQDAGAKVLTITLTSNFTADKTYREILAALNNGDIVKLVDWTGRNYIYGGMTSGRICFAYLNGYPSTDETDVFTIAVDETNSWEMFLDTITHLPDVSSADAGKVLTVDSRGAWVADNVPSELPAVTSADAGKVLTVDSQGAWGLSAPVMVLKATYNSSDRKYHWNNSLKNSEIISLIQDVPLIVVDLVTSNSFEHLYCTSKSLYTAKFAGIIDKGQSSYTNKYLIIRDTDNTDVLEVSSNYIAFT